MRKKMKSLIAVFLAVLMLVPLSVIAFAETDEEPTQPVEDYYDGGEVYPIVYVIGKVDTIYQVAGDKNSKVIYPSSLDNVQLDTITKELLPSVSKALAAEARNDQPVADKYWKEYGDALYKIIVDIFSELALDENGEASDGSGICWDWPKTPLYDMKKAGLYGLYDYTFHYDWRLDMSHNAKILDQYINEVLEVTGAEKCVLISRCYGCNLVTTYLQEYGYDAVDNCILYCSTAVGSVVCSEIFSGKINVNAEGLNYYLRDLFGGTNPIEQILGASLNSAVAEAGSWSVNKILEKVGDDLIPRALIKSFGSMPGYWSMVDDNHYAIAKDFAFGKDKNNLKKYEKLIEKMDYYHYGIQANVEYILQEAFDSGMRYANITKYGSQLVPVIEDQDFIGDSIVEVDSASLGATVTKVNETFDSDYLENAAYGGYYISPEIQIDAATALIPDCTWFVKGVDHFSFPECVDDLLLALSRYDGQMTIFSYGNFPQYLEYDDDGSLIDYVTDKFGDSNNVVMTYIRQLVAFIQSIIKMVRSIFGI